MNLKPSVPLFVPNKGLKPSAPFPPARYHVELAPGTTKYLAYPIEG